MNDKLKLPFTLIDIERELCCRSLANFARRAWPILEPTAHLKWGWALDAICEHLEAVTRGEILRLLINVPPGMMKSLLVNVMWPAWEWGPLNRPDLRYLSTAHKQPLAIRDNIKARRLITSEWYQKRWPLNMAGDQNATIKFENAHTGFIEAMAFNSMTGSRGDRVKIDDPLSVDGGNSEADLLSAERAFTESVPTRVNNDKSAIVVIMQRLHPRDTSGIILSKNLDYVHLMLPMRFEIERRCSTSIGFTDPRTVDGELIFPERFPEKDVQALEKILGSFAVAGQLQQRPAPREGGMFKRAWFATVPAIPHGTRFVRGWDLAATAGGTGARTAGVKIGRMPNGRFIIADCVKDRLAPAGVERLIKNTASQDGYAVKISMPQDPGQAGKDQASYLVLALAGYTAEATPESGDKEMRAQPLAAQAEAGNVDILKGDWNEEYLEEICAFPGSPQSDQMDASSRAFNSLALLPHFDISMMT